MKKLFFFTVIISLVTLGGFFGGKKVCLMMWPGSVNPSQAWYFQLGLDAGQARELQGLESSFRKQADGLCMKICKERLALLKTMRRKGADPEAVNRKIEEIGQLQVLLEKQIADHILEVKKDLTAEQSQVYFDRIHQELQRSIVQSGYSEILSE